MLSSITALLALTSTAVAVNHLNVQGANFVDSNTGERFEIIGVDYQPGANSGFNGDGSGDPLSDEKACLRDAIVMQNLGLNAIRVYNLDPTANHDACASIFNAAGIYMVLDVNSPLAGQSLDASAPWTTYDSDYLSHIFSVVEAFKNYDNLLGFFAGNEDINDDVTGGIDPPYVRAVTRDLKNYIAKHSSRPIPVGYAAAQVQDILQNQWNYFQCALPNSGNNDPSRSDFFALNSYSWCGDSSYTDSGYDVLVSWFSNTTIPVFFGEYGCNKVPQGTARPFTEVGALYGEPMRSTFSGGLVFEWTQETNDFGLVQVNSDNSIKLLGDFVNLQNQLNKLDIKGIEATNSTATNLKPPTCQASLITGNFSSNFTLPAVPPGGQDLINNGVSKPNTGSMVSVATTTLPYSVFATSGAEVPNLKLNVLSNDQSNAPGNNTSGGEGSGSGSGGTASSSSKALAAPTEMPRAAGVIAGSILMGALLL